MTFREKCIFNGMEDISLVNANIMLVCIMICKEEKDVLKMHQYTV